MSSRALIHLIQQDSFLISIVVMILIALPIPSVIDVLALKPSYPLKAILVEGWRLLTGHIVHASWPHVFINVLNLILLRLVFRDWISNCILISFVVFSGLFISFGLCIRSNLDAYMGFSGIFHGLLAFLLLHKWKYAPGLFTIAFICLVVKIVYEQLFGANAALADLIGIGIATDAHALGLASGLVFFVLIQLWRFFKSS